MRVVTVTPLQSHLGPESFLLENEAEVWKHQKESWGLPRLNHKPRPERSNKELQRRIGNAQLLRYAGGPPPQSRKYTKNGQKLAYYQLFSRHFLLSVPSLFLYPGGLVLKHCETTYCTCYSEYGVRVHYVVLFLRLFKGDISRG